MSRRRGITVLEVLVIICLCLLAVGLGIVLLSRHRYNAQQMQCRNNLREIGKAFHAYHDASAADEKLRFLPPSRIADGYATWGVLLAPYLLRDDPLQEWNKQQPYVAQPDAVREARVFMYFCPSRTRSSTLSEAGDIDRVNKLVPGGLGDYASVAGDGSQDHDWTGPSANGLLVMAIVAERKGERIVRWQSRTGLDSCVRGTAYTLIAGEKHVLEAHMADAAFGDGSFYNGAHPACFSRVAGQGFPLATAIESPFNNNFGSYHPGICQFLNADGSVRVMVNNADEAVLGKLARRGE